MNKVFFYALFAAITLLTGMSSCNNDNNIPGVTTGEDTGSLTFRVTSPELKMRALNPEASDFEKEVKTIHVFVYNEKGSLEKMTQFNATSDFTFNNENNTYNMNEGISVKDLTVGIKQLCVGVNMPSSLVAKVVANASAGMSAEYDEALSNMTDSANGFTMFSDNPVSVTVSANVTTAAGTIPVSRIMAKVSVKIKEGVDLNVAGGTISDVKFALQNLNQKFSLVPPLKADSGVNTEIPEVFNVVDNIPAGLAHDDKPVYALEHFLTSAAPETPTYVRVRCKFTPSNIITGAAGSWSNGGSLNGEGDFYTVSMADGVISYFATKTEADNFLADSSTLTAQNAFVTEYAKGEVDYGIFMGKTPNRFDIVRNHYYIITITSINGLGKDNNVEPQIEPQQKGNISFDLTVNEWIPVQYNDEQLS